MFQNPTWVAEEVRGMLSDSRKCERLAVRLLVRDLTGLEMRVCYKENGAPYLTDSHFNISISHTKGFAAVILSELPHPGIDIEYRSERAWKLHTKFLNAKELAFFDPHPYTQQVLIATICWCAKETAYKALQETEVDFIKHLHISPFTISDTGRLLLNETKTSAQETYQIQYQITDDYVLAWKA